MQQKKRGSLTEVAHCASGKGKGRASRETARDKRGVSDGNLGVPPGLLHQRRGAEVGFRPMQHFLPEKLYPVAANVKPVFL